MENNLQGNVWEELVGIVGLLSLSVLQLIKPTLQLSVLTLPSARLDHMDPVIAVWEPLQHYSLVQVETGKSGKDFSWHGFIWQVKMHMLSASTVGLLLYSEVLNYPSSNYLTPPHGGAAAIS